MLILERPEKIARYFAARPEQWVDELRRTKLAPGDDFLCRLVGLFEKYLLLEEVIQSFPYDTTTFQEKRRFEDCIGKQCYVTKWYKELVKTDLPLKVYISNNFWNVKNRNLLSLYLDCLPKLILLVAGRRDRVKANFCS